MPEGVGGVLVRDLQANKTELVSRASGADGAPDNGGGNGSSISSDGRYVAFPSTGTNLVSGDQDGVSDVFLRDRQTNTTVVVSRSNGTGAPDANAATWSAQISADGRYVSFPSDASNLVAGDANGNADVFRRDLQTNTNTVVSRASGQGPPDANASSYGGAISADGRYVAFFSAASNLAPRGDANGRADVFRRDLQDAQTQLVSSAPRVGLATTFEQKDQCPTSPTEATHCGGLNARATVALPGPVNPDQTVYFNLDFAVGQTGAFSLFLVPEAAP